MLRLITLDYVDILDNVCAKKKKDKKNREHMAVSTPKWPKSTDSPLSCAVAQEGSKLRSISVLEEQHQEALAEFKGARKLAKDLPHTVQEEQEDGSFLARFAVGVGGLGAAMLERVTRLGHMVKEVRGVTRRNAKNTSIKTIKWLLKVTAIAVWKVNISLCEVKSVSVHQ